MDSLVRKLLVGAIFFAVLTVFGVLSYRISRREVRHLARALIAEDGCVARAFFSPDDDLRGLLISLIHAESQMIRFAIYTLTDKAIAEALIQASERGVKIEGVVDRSYGQSRYSKVCVLANHRVPLWVYQTAEDERQAGLMHNKFMLFSDTIEHKALLWTGSYNFTNRATEKNQENVIILDNRFVIQAYEEYFERLKQQSLQISGMIQCSTEQSESSWFSSMRRIF